MRRYLVLVALVLATAMGASGYALVSCSADEQDAASVRVDPNRETRLQVPEGPMIVLPAGSTSGSGRLVAEELPETPALPTEVVSATGGGWDIRLEGTELVGAATLRFPVRAPDDVPAEVVEVLLTFYDQQQRQWVPVESRYDRRQQTVTATVEHLSLWNPVTWDYQGLLDAATSRFADLATAAEPDQPSCPGEDLARADGTRVVSDGTSRVKWCYGESDGKRLLRLANGRGYPALVSYPSGWDLQRQRSDSLAQAIGAQVIEAVTALPEGRSGVLLDGGQSVTLYPEQPPGSTALVGVEPSSGGYILGGLEYAGSTVEFVSDRVPGAGRDRRLSAIELESCVPELADTVGAAAVDDATSGLGAELVEKSLLCVARQAAVQTVYEEFFLSAVEWLADGSQQIVSGASGVADTLRTPYRIAITVPAAGECAGIVDCERVGNADVDGDGRRNTTRVSVSSSGAQGTDESEYSSISSDGRYVAFHSDASDLVEGDTNGYHGDVFVRDMQTGSTERVSVSTSGVQGNIQSDYSSISSDGRYVAFESNATNLVADDSNDGVLTDIFMRDRQSKTTQQVNVSDSGAPGNGSSHFPSISSDGRYVAFESSATNLVAGDTNNEADVFVRDRQEGTTERVSVGGSGAQADSGSYDPSISSDGRYVAFKSHASDLVAGDTNGSPDIFVRDRQEGTTERVSVSGPGAQGNDESYDPFISSDGRYVAFSSHASDLVAGDTSGWPDVFVHDRQSKTTQRVSVSSSGAQGNNESYDPSVSSGGRYVAFKSHASDLVAGDTNSNGYHGDVFVRDRQEGTTERVSVSTSGAQADSGSYAPSISSDGRYVTFSSWASNLVASDTNNSADVFMHEQ